MRKIIIFILAILTLSCFTACDGIFENINDAFQGADGKDKSISVTLTQYDGNGKLTTVEQIIEYETIAEFGGYENWLENSVTLWDIYRYETCFDILVNGEPIKEDYTIAPGDKIVLTEKGTKYNITINRTTYDGGNYTQTYRLVEPIELDYLFELLVDDSGLYAHHIDYFYQAYDITSNDAPCDTKLVASEDMTINVYKKEPVFRVKVIGFGYGIEEFDMYEPTDLYTTLFEYMWNGVRAEIFDEFDAYLGNEKIDDINDTKNHIIDKHNNLVIFKSKHAVPFKIDIDGIYQIDAYTAIPCYLDGLFTEYLGMSYEEAIKAFDIETDGKIEDGVLYDSDFVFLRSRSDKKQCEVKFIVYDTEGNIANTEQIMVEYATPLFRIRFAEFNPDEIDSNEDVYLNGELLTKNDMTKLITCDITIEKIPAPIPEDGKEDYYAKLTLIINEKPLAEYDFLKKFEGMYSTGDVFITNYEQLRTFKHAVTVDEAFKDLIGKSIDEMHRAGLSVTLSGEKCDEPFGHQARGDEPLVGDCSIYINKSIMVNVKYSFMNSNGNITRSGSTLFPANSWAKDLIISLKDNDGAYFSSSYFEENRMIFKYASDSDYHNYLSYYQVDASNSHVNVFESIGIREGWESYYPYLKDENGLPTVEVFFVEGKTYSVSFYYNGDFYGATTLSQIDILYSVFLRNSGINILSATDATVTIKDENGIDISPTEFTYYTRTIYITYTQNNDAMT